MAKSPRTKKSKKSPRGKAKASKKKFNPNGRIAVDSALKRLALRGGIYRVSKLAYPVLDQQIKDKVRELVNKAIQFTRADGIITINQQHVQSAAPFCDNLPIPLVHVKINRVEAKKIDGKSAKATASKSKRRAKTSTTTGSHMKKAQKNDGTLLTRASIEKFSRYYAEQQRKSTTNKSPYRFNRNAFITIQIIIENYIVVLVQLSKMLAQQQNQMTLKQEYIEMIRIIRGEVINYPFN